VIVIGTIIIFGQGYSTFIAPISGSNVVSSYIGLILAVVLYLGHKIWKRPGFVKNSEMDFETGTIRETVLDIRKDEGLDNDGNPVPKWRQIWNKVVDIIA
jgi:lysine-specific permease